MGDAELALGQRAAAKRDYERALASVAQGDQDSREKIQAKLAPLLRSR